MIQSLGILLLVVSFVSILARRVHLPYTVGLVTAGIILALFQATTPELTLSRDLIFTIFLPPLIFEAAFYIQWRELRLDIKPVLLLAVAGTAISALIIGSLTHILFEWPWDISLLFGAIICATDPVSVIATFKEQKVEGRLRLLVEAESLVNDGVAAVLFGIVLVSILGESATVETVGIALLREIIGGAFTGLLFGAGALFILRTTSDHLVETTITMIAAYGSFLLADTFHASGVLSTLVCGLMLGNLGISGALSQEGHEAVNTFWEFAAFLANSLIFILIGEELSRGNFVLHPFACVIAFFIITIARGIAVYSISRLLRGHDAIPQKFQHILFWGGLRGALSLALVLGLPSAFPMRSELMSLVFGVVAASILVQGLTMPLVLRKSNVLLEKS